MRWQVSKELVIAKKVISKLSIRALRIPVYIGWPEQERKKLQPIEVSVDIYLKRMPKACSSDELQDAICYDELCTAIRTHCKTESYRLVEALCFGLYTVLKEKIPGNSDLWVEVTKLKPPVRGLRAASFSCGDLPSF